VEAGSRHEKLYAQLKEHYLHRIAALNKTKRKKDFIQEPTPKNKSLTTMK